MDVSIDNSTVLATKSQGDSLPGDPQAYARELYAQALADNRAARYERAIETLQRTLSIKNSGFDKVSIGKIHYNLGIAFYRLGQYDEALAAYLSAQSVHRGIDDRKSLSLSLNGIGNVHYARSDYANALQYYKEGMEIDEALGDRPAMAVAYNNIGLVYGGLGDMTRAREFLERSKEIRSELGDIAGVAYCLNNLGYSWYIEKEYERARELLQHCLELREQEGDRYGAVNSLTLLARIHLGMQDYDAAIANLTQALPLALKIKLQRELLDVYELLAEAHKHKGEFKQALEFFEQFHERSREVFNAQSEERMQKLVVKHKLERAQYDKEMYRLRNEQLEMALHRKNDELATMALLLVQKAEMINNFRRQLPQLFSNGADAGQFDAAMQELDRMLGLSKEWETFERGLQETHQDFVRHLAARFPALSPTELRLCTLIKLGLSNKDISGLMNVGLRDVENHRYRIRRKFELKRQHKLDRFLLEYDKQLRLDGQNSAPDLSPSAEGKGAAGTLAVQSLSLKLPELSPMEVKVCSLLILSMSSKEIAASLSLSVRTVERHRLRIRRKLGLARNANLTTYLASLT